MSPMSFALAGGFFITGAIWEAVISFYPGIKTEFAGPTES